MMRVYLPTGPDAARFCWTLADQAVVSVGTFAVNIAVARLLSRSDYGAFSALFASLLLLQIVNMSIVFYPATISLADADEDRGEVVAFVLSMLALVMVPLVLAMVAALAAFGEIRLAPEAAGWFAAWQIQEAMRRLLFAEFRYRAAMIGDALSYLGQAGGVAALAWTGHLSLTSVLAVLGATSLVAATVQAAQVGVVWRRPRGFAGRFRAHWRLGSWSLAASVVAALRFQALLWFVGATGGRADVASFQAAMNVPNAVNPVMTGICNLVPQTVAGASSGGLRAALRAAHPYLFWGFVPIAAYLAVVAAAPGPVLRMFYGGSSPYLGEHAALRLLALSMALGYAGEMIAALLHGASNPRPVWAMNLAALAATTVTFAACHGAYGWTAAALALAVGQAVRLPWGWSLARDAASRSPRHPAGKPFRLLRPRA